MQLQIWNSPTFCTYSWVFFKKIWQSQIISVNLILVAMAISCLYHVVMCGNVKCHAALVMCGYVKYHTALVVCGYVKCHAALVMCGYVKCHTALVMYGNVKCHTALVMCGNVKCHAALVICQMSRCPYDVTHIYWYYLYKHCWWQKAWHCCAQYWQWHRKTMQWFHQLQLTSWSRLCLTSLSLSADTGSSALTWSLVLTSQLRVSPRDVLNFSPSTVAPSSALFLSATQT